MQQAQQDVSIQVSPSGQIQLSAPQQGMRPLTDREVRAIRDRRSDISNQLESATDRRNDLAGELKDATPGTEPGVLQRIQLLDARILTIERDMEESGRMLRTGLTVDNGVALVAPQNGPFGNMEQETIAILGTAFSVFFLLPIAIGFMRLAFRRAKRGAVPVNSGEQDARMERLEQAMDAVALEVERVGESQRYQSKVLSEANLIPALGAGQRAAEAIRAREFEGLRDK